MEIDSQDTGPPRNIGVFHLNQVGDLVFSLPALAALRQRFPKARITSILHRPLAELLHENPLVDRCLTHRRAGDLPGTALRVRREAFDLVVCLSQSARVMLLARWSRAPQRIGFSGGPLASLLTQQVPKDSVSSVANNLRLVEAMGCTVPQRSYRGLLLVEEEDRRRARQRLQEAGVPGISQLKLVVIAPSASARRREKEWVLDRFLEVGRMVASSDTRVLFVGAEPLFDPGWNDPEILDLGGRTTFREILGILEMATLFLGIDSGLLHLAAALGTPCVALFGPTDPRLTGPQGEQHIVLREDGSPTSLDGLSVKRVAAAVEEVLTQCT